VVVVVGGEVLIAGLGRGASLVRSCSSVAVGGDRGGRGGFGVGGGGRFLAVCGWSARPWRVEVNVVGGATGCRWGGGVLDGGGAQWGAGGWGGVSRWGGVGSILAGGVRELFGSRTVKGRGWGWMGVGVSWGG